jgi:hypothetical protein
MVFADWKAKSEAGRRVTPVMEPQKLEHPLCVGNEFLQGLIGAFGRSVPKKLDFVELVNADEAALLLPIASGLPPKTGSIGHVFQGEPFLLEDLVVMEIGQKGLGCGVKEKVVFRAMIKFIREFGELARDQKGAAVGKDGRKNRDVPVLARVELQHPMEEGDIPGEPLRPHTWESGFRRA